MLKIKIEGPKRGWQFGVGFLELLGLLFVGLKLGNVVDWPWWAVTAPWWSLPALALVGAAIASLGHSTTKLGHSLQVRGKAMSAPPVPIGDAEAKALDRIAKEG